MHFCRRLVARLNCKFCLTALMGLERNLSAGEIVGQVLLLLRQHHWNPDNAGEHRCDGNGEPL